jgi:hypothetical protein
MSEPHSEPAEHEAEETEGPAVEEEAGGQDEGGEGEETDDEGEAAAKARKPSDDWEKKAHNQAGRAARERSRRVAAEKRASDLEGRLEALEKGGGSREDRDDLLDLIASLPDTEDDPISDIAGVKRALKLFRQRQVDEGQQTAQQRQLERQFDNLRSAMLDAEADFGADQPDYPDAANFYKKARIEELTDAGYSGKNLDRKLADDLFGVVRMALEAGLDPAERVYALAKRRGFKSGGKAADAKLDATRRAAESGVRPQGRPGAGVLSWGDVAKLDGAARDKAWAKLREREMARK